MVKNLNFVFFYRKDPIIIHPKAPERKNVDPNNYESDWLNSLYFSIIRSIDM